MTTESTGGSAMKHKRIAVHLECLAIIISVAIPALFSLACGNGGGGNGETDNETNPAFIRLSIKHGPFPVLGTEPSTGRVIWSFQPVTITGSSGRKTAFTVDKNYSAMSVQEGTDPTGRPQYWYYFNETVTDVAIGTWTVTASEPGIPAWSTSCEVTLKTKQNSINFRDGREGCLVNDPKYPGD
jgi:hypothetical protein